MVRSGRRKQEFDIRDEEPFWEVEDDFSGASTATAVLESPAGRGMRLPTYSRTRLLALGGLLALAAFAIGLTQVHLVDDFHPGSHRAAARTVAEERPSVPAVQKAVATPQDTAPRTAARPDRRHGSPRRRHHRRTRHPAAKHARRSRRSPSPARAVRASHPARSAPAASAPATKRAPVAAPAPSSGGGGGSSGAGSGGGGGGSGSGGGSGGGRGSGGSSGDSTSGSSGSDEFGIEP